MARERVKPINGRVLGARIPKPEISKYGIVAPDMAVDPSQVILVIASGVDWIKDGSIALVRSHVGHEFELMGEKVSLFAEDEVLGEFSEVESLETQAEPLRKIFF